MMERYARSSTLMLYILFLIILPFINPGSYYHIISAPNNVSELNNFKFNASERQGVSQTSLQVSIQYENHSPILIVNNLNFRDTAEVENWPGNGTLSFPYLINGYNITGPSNKDLIQVRDTNVHFQIRNCLLSGGKYGISLNNVENGQVSHNIICNNIQGGIHLPDSINNIITNNTILNNDGDGIRLLGSNDNTLSGNEIFNNNDYAIIIEYSGTNTLSNNNITNNGRIGIFLYSCSSSTISNNIIFDHGMDGIRLHTTENSFLDNNTVCYTANGIYLQWSGNSRLTSNNVTNNRGNGIVISHSNSCTLSNNTAKNNDVGILIISSSNNSVLSHNSVINNMDGGIRAYSSSNNRLSNNIIIDNNAYGISLDNSGNNIILNNTQVNNGLIISGDQFNDFLQNLVRNNSVNGKALIYWQGITHSSVPSGASQVILVSCTNVVVSDQNLTKVPVGVFVAFSSYLSIHNNTFINNRDHGIILENSDNNRVVFNDFYSSQVADFGSNNLFAYNYWDAWISPDNNEDGIVDEPYSIVDSANNKDTHPLTFPNPPQSHFLMSPTVFHPYGGETLSGDFTIDWMSSVDSWDHDLTYSVFYSANEGITWVLLETGLNTTYYTWDTMTVEDGSQHLIRINTSCNEGKWHVFTSNATFTINNHHHTQPFAVLSPEGRDLFWGSVIIEWTAAADFFGHSVTYSIVYSADNGQSWVMLESDLTATYYTWDTWAVVDGSQYLVRINASCTEGSWHVSTSDTSFTINNHQHFQSFTLLSPEGGETYFGPVFIEWSSVEDIFNHSISYTVSYSPDNGISWIFLASNLTTTSFIWDSVNVEDGALYLIQVNASCWEGSWQVAISSAILAIDNVPPITTDFPPTQTSNSSSQSNPTLDLLPILQILGPVTILFFVATVVIIVRRQRLGS